MKKVYMLIVAILILSLCACSTSQGQNSKGFAENKELTSNYNNLEDCFEGINGCAIITDSQNSKYYFHNEDMARVRVSPYSTFKVMATLIGLQNGVIKDEKSTMKYNGTEYPLDVWNGNLSLDQAFKSSCIWYFRQVIDAVGKNEVEKELKDISYGNCDVSEWNGNDTNPMPDLNGFWINSSLQISPVEQVSVLCQIFGNQSVYSEDNVKTLKNIMLVEDNGTSKIYGKTGSGQDGKAWFIGFKEQGDTCDYFTVYLDDQEKQEDINGQKAKEIALKIMA